MVGTPADRLIRIQPRAADAGFSILPAVFHVIPCGDSAFCLKERPHRFGGDSPARFEWDGGAAAPWRAVPKPGIFQGGWNRRNFSIFFSRLRGRVDHNCVLFVQHPSENTCLRPGPKRSFVVCAKTFSNCERATEGGIPRSSRSRWFA